MFDITVEVPRVTQNDFNAVVFALRDNEAVHRIGFDNVVSMPIVDSDSRAIDVGTHKAHTMTNRYEYIKSVKQVELIDNVYHVTFVISGD